MSQRYTDPSAIELDGPWRHRLLHSRGVRLHCVDSGDAEKPLVLLVHGFAGGWFDWQWVMPALAEHAHVVALDLRGVGLSDKTPRGYSIASTASDIAGMVIALGHQEAVVVAHSDSVPAAVAASLLEPDRVRAVVALNPTHPEANMRLFLRHPHKHRRRLQLALSVAWPRLGSRWLSTDHAALVDNMCASLSGPAFVNSPRFDTALSIRRTALGIEQAAYYSCLRRKKAVRAMMSAPIARVTVADWSTWALNHQRTMTTALGPASGGTQTAASADALAAELAEAAPPVHVVHGGADPLVRASRHAVRAVAQGSADTPAGGAHTVTVVPRIGHYLHLEAPNEVARIVRRILDDQETQ